MREYSLLANPRTPAAVLASQATTTILGSASADSIEEDAPRGGSAADSGDGAVREQAGVADAAGARELNRLHTDYTDVSVLTIRGLSTVDELYKRGLLDGRHMARLEREFHSVGGSWCCANQDDLKRGMPNNHGFRLPMLPSPAVRATLQPGSGGTSSAPDDGGQGAFFANLFGG